VPLKRRPDGLFTRYAVMEKAGFGQLSAVQNQEPYSSLRGDGLSMWSFIIGFEAHILVSICMYRTKTQPATSSLPLVGQALHTCNCIRLISYSVLVLSNPIAFVYIHVPALYDSWTFCL
jgi:hypothetical protein